MFETRGMLPALSIKRGRRACWSFRMGLGWGTSFSYSFESASFIEAPLVLGQAKGDFGFTRLIIAWTRWSHHLPQYNILCICPRHLHPNDFLSRDSQGGVPKLSWFGLLRFCKLVTFFSDLRLGWGLKQTCSSPWEFSNGVSHPTYTHQGRIDSRLLVVGPSFCHSLCCKCPNGSCKTIFNIYTSIAF